MSFTVAVARGYNDSGNLLTNIEELTFYLSKLFLSEY